MDELHWMQRWLWYFLLGLLALMVFFSLLAIKDKGKQGYDRCVAEKCATRGEDYCHKFRELSNCCLGAGGEMAVANQQYECGFP